MARWKSHENPIRTSLILYEKVVFYAILMWFSCNFQEAISPKIDLNWETKNIVVLEKFMKKEALKNNSVLKVKTTNFENMKIRL